MARGRTNRIWYSAGALIGRERNSTTRSGGVGSCSEQYVGIERAMELAQPGYCTAPNAAEIEVAVFGPGVGESVVCHLGGGNWIIVDSCLDDYKPRRPAALEYLRILGVDPATSVKMVVATHFDGDHTDGMPEIVDAASSATFCVSEALGRPEYFSFIERADIAATYEEYKIGVRQMGQALRKLRDAGRSVRKASADRDLILPIEANHSGHGHRVTVRALAPSDTEIDNADLLIASSIPGPGTPIRFGQTRLRNEHSIVIWIDFQIGRVLLGGDLEDRPDNRTGWKAVLQKAPSLGGRASAFKIPHHGSDTGYNRDVWDQMLEPAPLALLAPFSRSKLPTSNDAAKILTHTNDAHASSDNKAKKSNYAPSVTKIIRRQTTSFRSIRSTFGAVRARLDLAKSSPNWRVEYIGGSACHLSAFVV